MKSAYDISHLHNLYIRKEARLWLKSKLISSEQFAALQASYPSSFFHPNVMIRILLFIAGAIAIGGVSGIFFLVFDGLDKFAMTVMVTLYGAGLVLVLERGFLRKYRHYKSGVTEALLYYAMGFMIAGLPGLADYNKHVMILCCVMVFTLSAIRYHDVLTTLAAMASWAYLVFFELFGLGKTVHPFIPLVVMIVFIPVYFLLRRLRHRREWHLWNDCLVVAEALCLCIIYAAGNYFVVREASEKLLSFYVQPGDDIPFAWLFYFLTVSIPALYLYFSIVRKDVVLLRVSLAALAFSAFTFKYYYSTGHHEITFTVAGIFLILVSIALLRYLKTVRNGFTRENILADKWASAQAEAMVIAQTLGGNKNTVEPGRPGGGGSFGGGGASGEF